MPGSLQAFIWVLGIAIIVLLIGIVGFLIKDKLNTVIAKMDEIHVNVVELFKEDKAKVKAIEEIKGDIKAINARCQTIKCIQEVK